LLPLEESAAAGGVDYELARVAAHGRDGNGVAWMELGVLMLLATPIMRVVVLAIGWERGAMDGWHWWRLRCWCYWQRAFT